MGQEHQVSWMKVLFEFDQSIHSNFLQLVLNDRQKTGKCIAATFKMTSDIDMLFICHLV